MTAHGRKSSVTSLVAARFSTYLYNRARLNPKDKGRQSCAPRQSIYFHQWQRVTFTIYDLSISFFEAVIVDALVRGGGRKVLILPYVQASARTSSSRWPAPNFPPLISRDRRLLTCPAKAYQVEVEGTACWRARYRLMVADIVVTDVDGARLCLNATQRR